MAYTGHGHHIPGTVVSKTPPRQRARCGGPGMCAECTTDSIRSLTRIAKVTIQALGAISDLDGVLDITLDREQVLHKVLNSLRLTGVDEDKAMSAIIFMQNDGILFRERIQ